MTLTPAFLDELRARTSLSALIAKTTKLTRAGREMRGCCPFHQEKTPSFYVNDDKGFYHCLAGETKVVTALGRKEIAGLAGRTVDVLTRGGRWVPARFDSYGEQRLREIELTRNGVRKSIFATSGHRWFVHGRAGALTTDGLRPGHALQAALPPRREDWTLDARGVRHGIVFGDGTMTREVYGSVNLHGEKDAALAGWFPDQEHHAHRRPNGQAYLRVYGGRAFEGMKRLPDLDAADGYLLGFLAGHLAADGHVAKDGTVILHSACADTLDGVRDIATRLGIATFGRTTLSRSGFGAEPSPIHRIHFVRSTLSEQLFLLPQARERFAARSHAFERLRWVVQAVRDTDRVETVYCASVPGEHAFALDDDILTGNCFGCSAHGDAIRWMTDSQGLPFMDAVKDLAAAAGLDVPAPDPRSAERQERARGLHDVTQAASDWFEAQLAGLAGADAQALLKKRGVTPATAKAFNLGFAPDSRGKLRTALKEHGDPTLVETGLLIQVEGKDPYDRFRGRLIIPIRDPRGRVIAFGGRIIGEGEPKYLNSPDTPLFDKGRTLFNLDKAAPAARRADRVLVVEGYMDVIALAQAGIAETVAPLGTALTEAQLERLWRMVPVPFLCFDGDAAGQKAALRAAHRALPMLAPGRSLAFVTLPPGQDPDDVVRQSGRDAFEALLAEAEPLVDRLWKAELAAEPLDTPERRAGLKRRLADHAATIADGNVRAEYQSEFRRRFDAHFAPPPRKPFERRPFDRNAKWKVPILPVTADAHAVRATGIDRVLAKAVLAGLIRHPAEIARHMEVLGSLRMAAKDPGDALGRLFAAVVDVALEDHALDSARLVSILAGSGLGPVASDLLRADTTPYSFTQPTGDPVRAHADLDEAIAILVARPEVDEALAEATAAMRDRFTAEAFERQVALVREKAALEERLANLCQANEDARHFGSEGD